MSSRAIYASPRIGKIEQGTIFNGGIAEEYTNCSVYGIIITPRCDISNGKVSTYHYLPVVSFNDWKIRDFWHIFSYQLEKRLSQGITEIFSRYNLSSSLIEKFDLDIVKDKSLPKIGKAKDFQKCEKYINDLILLKTEHLKALPCNSSFSYFLNEYGKIARAILKELVGNKRKGFYLIESWEDSEEYFVILLREIKRIKVEIADRLAQGFYAGELSQIEIELNDLQEYLPNDELLYGMKRIISPFMEHIIQLFFQNFGRIGVTDHEHNLPDVLLKNIKLP